MESQIKSSFIPTDTAQKPQQRRAAYARGAVDLLMLGSIILLFASLALGIGVFLYHQFLLSSISSKSEQLQRAQAAFEPALIQELTRVDTRMNMAEDILYNHLAPSVFFGIMEDITLQTVQYNTLDFHVADRSNITLELSGIAQSVNSIALQADLLGQHRAVTSPIFSNINRQENGVRFDMSATVNPAEIRYPNVVGGQPVQQQQQQPASGATSTQQTESEGIPIFAP